MRVAAAVCVAAAMAGCESNIPKYVQNPGGPTIQTPTSLTLRAQVGIGATATQAILIARVLDQDGRGIPNMPVSFASSHGTIAPVNLSTNSNGDAQTTLTSGVSSTVTVAGAGFTTSMTVTIDAPLLVSLSLPSPEKTRPVSIRALVTPAPTAPARYVWNFGDGSTAQTSTEATSHAWADDGPVTLTVSVTDALERSGLGSTSITVRDNPEPPAPPPPDPAQPPPTGFMLTLSCATQTALRVDCLAVGSFAGNPLQSALLTNVTWDWGDSTVQLGNVARAHVYPAAGTYHVFVSATYGPDDAWTTALATAK